jgi:hypothetical protein
MAAVDRRRRNYKKTQNKAKRGIVRRAFNFLPTGHVIPNKLVTGLDDFDLCGLK